jgi:Transglycosylase SLT domain
VSISIRRLLLLGLLAARPAWAQSVTAAQPDAAQGEQGGTVGAIVCPLVESAAHDNHIPVALLTRLIWTESRFQAHAVSPKGAQGIAQFMPETAAERGLTDPFDPEQAIPEVARLVADLARRFGNLGLAAAAYNAGADRVADWLAGTATLPGETAAYVVALTGLGAVDWARGRATTEAANLDGGQSCTEITAALHTEGGDTVEGPLAPWGVQLAGNFSKPVALASFERVQQRYRRILGEARPMILGGVLRSRGTRRFYRVMLPEASRDDADRTCGAIMRLGGACVPVRT